MILVLSALQLVAMAAATQVAAIPAQTAPPPATSPIELVIDDCVGVDRYQVSHLVLTEFRLHAPTGHLRVAVTCQGELNRVRVLDSGSHTEIAREVDLKAFGEAAREAKARELALIIGELIRAVRMRPAQPERAAVVVAASPPPQPAPAPPPPRSYLELAAFVGLERYSRGHAQWGPGLALRFLPTRYLVLELRGGARFVETQSSPSGDIAARGLLASAGLGINVFPEERRVGLALMVRAELDWLQIEGSSNGDAEGVVSRGTAGVVSAGPSAWFALGQSLRIIAEPSALLPFHTLTIQDQGTRVSSLAGIGMAATLGLAGQF